MPAVFTPQQMSFTLGQIALNFCLAFSLSYLAAALYRRLYSGPGYSFAFFITLIVTPVVVAMIMMAIGSNVALSLGLVGALSIIRFRTVVKDSRDMAFLFFMIGIGLCCGSGAYALAIVGTGFICLVLFGLHFVARNRGSASEYLLVFRKEDAEEKEAEQALDDLVTWRRLHGASDLGKDGGVEYTYRVRLGPTVSPENLLSRLKSVRGLSGSALISPESQLAI